MENNITIWPMVVYSSIKYYVLYIHAALDILNGIIRNINHSVSDDNNWIIIMKCLVVIYV